MIRDAEAVEWKPAKREDGAARLDEGARVATARESDLANIMANRNESER